MNFSSIRFSSDRPYFHSEQREGLEEENRQVHQTNSNTIARLQELESSTTQLQVKIEDSLLIFSQFTVHRSILIESRGFVDEGTTTVHRTDSKP